MFDLHYVRSMFPALAREQNGEPVVYLDGPGGTQTPRSVPAAMASVLEKGISNLGGQFASSRDAETITASARRAAADLVNAEPGEIAFGQNMTSLTFAASRALAREWLPGDEIVVTRLDHDANIAPWLLAAAERDVTVRWLDFLPEHGYDLDYGSLERLVNARTRLVAVTHASNALGTIVDVPRLVEAAHSVGALVFVDAVHHTPHAPIDVAALGCDFLVASAYKFYGPHTGFLYGRTDLLDRLDAYKVRPAPAHPPGKWETGTQSFESLAGVTAAIDYLSSLGGDAAEAGRRAGLQAGLEAVGVHEQILIDAFVAGVEARDFIHIFGPGRSGRTPTFAVAVDGLSPLAVQRRLAERGIFVWAGHYYAVEVMKRLGRPEGLVRIGFVHYNTIDELERLMEALDETVAGR